MSSEITSENMAERNVKHEDKNNKSGVVTKHVENESFNRLLVYDSDSSSSSASSEIHDLGLDWQVRDDEDDVSEESESSDDDDDDDDDEESSEDSDDDSPNEEPPPQSKGAIKKDKISVKSPGELSLDELPPVPDLSSLSISEGENFVHMGSVLGIVDKLVTVAAIPNTPAYDLDTLLFLEEGRRPLGFIFDVLGQVASPIYAVRFNSVEDIKNLNVEIGTKVYSAPMSKHTQYVFLQQLLKMKGSDASWMGDNEVPLEFADFSDDESEHCQRKSHLHSKRPHGDDSHKRFESTMNKRNILNTKFNKYMDSYKQARFNKSRERRPPPGLQISPSLPPFDPSVPPPTVRPLLSFYRNPYEAPPPAEAQENNNGSGFSQGVFLGNFIANFGQHQGNSANYFTNHAAGNPNPGPSHQ